MVSDSAGVRLVELDPAQLPVLRQVAPSPDWVVGEEAGARAHLLLNGVEDALLVDGSLLFIAHRGTQEVLRVDLDSGGVDWWGGEEDGPGEFRGLARIVSRPGGGVGAYDRIRRRYLELDAEGAAQEALALPALGPGGEPPVLEISGQGGESDRFFLAHVTGLPAEAGEGTHRGAGPVTVLSRDGRADTLATIPGREVWVGAGGAGPVLFGATTLMAAGPAGLWVGDTAEPLVDHLSPEGALLARVRWREREARELTPERLDDFWREVEEETPGAERPMVAQARQLVQAAGEVPAFGQLLVDPAGALWIGAFVAPEAEIFQTPQPEQEWWVVDPEEGRVERLITPQGFRLLWVGEATVVGVHRDALGVESVRGYRLEPAG